MDLEQFKLLHKNRLKEVEQSQKQLEQQAFDNITHFKVREEQVNKETKYSEKSKSRKQLRKKVRDFKTKEYKYKKNYL